MLNFMPNLSLNNYPFLQPFLPPNQNKRSFSMIRIDCWKKTQKIIDGFFIQNSDKTTRQEKRTNPSQPLPSPTTQGNAQRPLPYPSQTRPPHRDSSENTKRQEKRRN